MTSFTLIGVIKAFQKRQILDENDAICITKVFFCVFNDTNANFFLSIISTFLIVGRSLTII